MTATEVNKEDLRGIVADALEADREEVGDQADFAEELEVDSLVQLEISSQVENSYGISIEEVLASGVTTLDELYGFVTARLAERHPA
ncbi:MULTISPECIES: acyl carrier protein [Streptomyces]|uniref:Thioesterase n=1 Tax=Streptomyces albus (strain ATCC 21838 / DSM 41398 / FERM P-419 / JCM 4703 / NBRC 107858) TaxID=1081613 RepID=A0A0B5EMJ6_STRA4|nr:acyl carrier protein [Streptomyces sp. SCSIO ZS0520]AJE83703.1 thioesterase [Streptomyces albus]AOU78010.1 thioesterase [Streptomyces albus]AYN33765.1 thioesterase [Streptomyces albus]